MKVLALDERDVLSLCRMEDCIQAVSMGFSASGDGRVDDPLRTRINVAGPRNVLVMPSLIRDGANRMSLKLVSVYPDLGDGRPSISSTLLLVDGSDGAVTSVMDGRALTSLRTGAVSGLSCRYLARRDSRVLGIIGAGGQAYHQVSGAVSELDIREVRIFSRTVEKSVALARRCQAELRVDAVAVEDVARCVTGCDVVVTSTPSKTPLFDGGLVEPGTHVVAIGSYTPEARELDTELVTKASVFVDSKAACLAEAGDILIPIGEGTMTADAIRGELSDLIAGKVSGRLDASEITVFKSVGLPFEDNVVGWMVYTKALAAGVGKGMEF